MPREGSVFVLVRSIAAGLHRQFPSSDVDDLRQAGSLAVLEQRVREPKITRVRIRGAMLDLLRSEMRHRHGELFDIAAPRPRYEITDLLHGLPASCTQVMQLRLAGYSRRAAALELGITSSRARTLEQVAVERLRRPALRRAA